MKKKGEKCFRTNGAAVPGPDYVCSKCGAAGLRLWRQSNTFLDYVELFCATCAEGDQKDTIAKYADFHRDTDSTIGDLVPARPTPEGDTFWGQTSGDVEWWYALPQYADIRREVAQLRRERDHFVDSHQRALEHELSLYREISGLKQTARSK